jgi:hypothetical protein
MTQNGTAAQVTTPNGIAVGAIVIYDGGFGERPYTVTALEQNSLRLRLVDSHGIPFPVAPVYTTCRLAHPRPAPVEPTPAPATFARPRGRRTVTTCTRRQPVTKPALPKVTKESRPTRFRNGKTQQQCWAATTVDGVWRIERQDDVNTVWVITHCASGFEVPQWFGTLPRALAAIADGYADSTLPTVNATA